MIRLALTYGSVGFTAAAAYLGLDQGQEITAAALLVVGLLLVGVRLGLAGALPRPSRPSRPSRSTVRRAGAFVVAFSLVSGMILGGVGPGGGAVGTASAWEMGTVGECDGLDYMVHLVSFQQVNSDSCDLRYGDNSNLETHTDHYQQGESWKSQNDGFFTSHENFAEDTSSIAFSKAKITIVNGLNDGNTSSVVKGEANQTVRDYYSRQQKEILMQADRYYRSAEYTDSVNDSFINGGEYDPITAWAEVEIQLINGSTVWVRLPAYDSGDDNWISAPPQNTGNTRNATATIHGIDSPMQDRHPHYAPPSGDYSEIVPLNLNRVIDNLNTYGTQSQQVTQNVDVYVDGVYTEYQQGEINTTDIVDPQTLASQAATDYNSSGYYSYAAIHLASLGYSGNMNSSMHVTTANNSYNGTLFYTADDVDTFEVNQSYDPSTLNGTAYMAVQDGENGTVVSLSETFTVESATNPKTGESMSNVTVEKYTYDSTNTSALASELDRLRQLREEYEQAQNTGGSGGFDLGGKTGAIGALLAVVVILALTRD